MMTLKKAFMLAASAMLGLLVLAGAVGILLTGIVDADPNSGVVKAVIIAVSFIGGTCLLGVLIISSSFIYNVFNAIETKGKF